MTRIFDNDAPYVTVLAGGKLFCPEQPEPEPVKCYWCDEPIEDDDDVVMYNGKPHHHICAIEDERDDKGAA